MTDINKNNFRKSCWSYSVQLMSNVDFHYEERVIASCTFEEARDKIYLSSIDNPLWYFRALSSLFCQDPPALDGSSQRLQYLKTKDLGLVTYQFRMTTFSFGLIIHTGSSIWISPTDMSLQYPNLFEKKEERLVSPERNHFGNVSLAKEKPMEGNISFHLF